MKFVGLWLFYFAGGGTLTRSAFGINGKFRQYLLADVGDSVLKNIQELIRR